MKTMVTELALNLKHKKKLLRDDILPDLDSRIKAMIAHSIKDYEEKIKSETEKKGPRDDFLINVRKRLGEVVSNMEQIHVTEDNTVVDVVGSDKFLKKK
jgi:hypothetical protein